VTGRSATTSSMRTDVRSLSCPPFGGQVRDDTAEGVGVRYERLLHGEAGARTHDRGCTGHRRAVLCLISSCGRMS